MGDKGMDKALKEIGDEVSEVHAAERASNRCECGGLLKSKMQVLIFDEELGAMVDLMVSKCVSCEKETRRSYPLRSAPMMAIAEHLKNEENQNQMG